MSSKKYEKYKYLLDKYSEVKEDELPGLVLAANLDEDHSDFMYVFEGLLQLRHDNRVRGPDHIRAASLVEVQSVLIKKTKPDGKPCQIYGHIYGRGGKFTYKIFDQLRDDPQEVKSGDYLLLSSPNEKCSKFHKFTSIEMELRDKAHKDAVIASGCFPLVDRDEDKYRDDHLEVPQLELVDGKIGSAVVAYIDIPYAIMACVYVFVNQKSNNQEARYVDVSGQIIAQSDNTLANYDSSATLFNKKKVEEFERVEFGKPIALSKCWIAVPAYSSLALELALFQFDTKRPIIKNIRTYPANEWGSMEILEGSGYDIEVHILWKYPVPSKGIQEELNNNGKQQKHKSLLRSLSSLLSPPAPPVSISKGPSNDKPTGVPLTELFSLCIGCKSRQALKLYGTIRVTCNSGTGYLFNRERDYALELPYDHRVLPIIDPPTVLRGSPLEIKFDVRDVEGVLSIKGNMSWVEAGIESDISGISWYDRRLCSIFRGHSGFAALHYTMFSFAVQVKVHVFCKPKASGSNVYGTIVAEYKNYNYSTRFRRDHYRSVLFQRSDNNSVELMGNSPLELSRSVITVPSSSSLVLKIDLSIGVDGQNLDSRAEIEIGSSSETIKSSVCDLDIGFEWSSLSL